jgi:hypothetical protein
MAERPERLVAGIVVHAALMAALSVHEVWRPWTAGVVTRAFGEVAWAWGLGCAVQMVGNLALLASGARWLRRLVDAACAAAALLGVAGFVRVFPLDLSHAGEDAEVLARRALLALTLGLAAATAVQVTRLARAVNPRAGIGPLTLRRRPRIPAAHA